MKNVATLLLLLCFIGCNSQEKEKKPLKEAQKETLPEPQEKWDVKKEYDEFGNLIKYDSIYSYSYSTMQGDSVNINLDSVMRSFRHYFEKGSPFGRNDQFSYYPERDSLFMQDFFRDDYFSDHWKRQPVDVEKMIRQMDSSRNEFLKRFYPGLQDSKIIN